MSPGQEKPGPTPEARLQSANATSTPLDEKGSSVAYAVGVLGEILNVAFSDALRLDGLARQAVDAFGNIDAPDRVALAGEYPKLVEALILLEVQIDRMNRR